MSDTPSNPRPFPYDRRDMPLEAYFMRLLAALTVQAGGELRIKAQAILNLDPASALVRTVDSKKGEIVLRFGSKHSEMYFIPSEQSTPSDSEGGEWQRNREVRTRQAVSPPLPMSASLRDRDPRIPPNPTDMQEWLTGNEIENPSRSRHQVLDDMRIFLQEQKINQSKSQRERQEEMIRKNRSATRSGMMPFRTVQGSRP